MKMALQFEHVVLSLLTFTCGSKLWEFVCGQYGDWQAWTQERDFATT